MNVIERKIYTSTGNHIGSIFTLIEPGRINSDRKAIVEQIIVDYARDTLYDNHIGSIFSDIKEDLASITVLFEINDLEYNSHNIEL